MNLNAGISPYNNRSIEYIVLHCTATSQDTKVESIFNYWKQELGWKNPGYHFIINADGYINIVQSVDRPTNGVKGNNYNSIHIAYIGGVDDNNNAVDNRTPQQKISQLELIVHLKELYPEAKVIGHRDFEGVTKECPSFDVGSWLNGVEV